MESENVFYYEIAARKFKSSILFFKKSFQFSQWRPQLLLLLAFFVHESRSKSSLTAVSCLTMKIFQNWKLHDLFELSIKLFISLSLLNSQRETKLNLCFSWIFNLPRFVFLVIDFHLKLFNKFTDREFLMCIFHFANWNCFKYLLFTFLQTLARIKTLN